MSITANIVTHTLANGARVLSASPGHGFKFSDGTECGPQVKEVADALNCERKTTFRCKLHDMDVNQTQMVLSEAQLQTLGQLCEQADIVIIPFPVLTALRDQGVRDNYPNALAFNSTLETQRAAPADKIVDLNNWSY
jgi:hypothetical protein